MMKKSDTATRAIDKSRILLLLEDSFDSEFGESPKIYYRNRVFNSM
jgi:hypothetical protein